MEVFGKSYLNGNDFGKIFTKNYIVFTDANHIASSRVDQIVIGLVQKLALHL